VRDAVSLEHFGDEAGAGYITHIAVICHFILEKRLGFDKTCERRRSILG